MRDQELVNALCEHAEWARANEWETPITLGDDLTEAADVIEKLRVTAEELAKESDAAVADIEAARGVFVECADTMERVEIQLRIIATENAGNGVASRRRREMGVTIICKKTGRSICNIEDAQRAAAARRGGQDA